MPLYKYDYILAIGTIFAFLDAYCIGANDVANSWANSVAARSVSYLQAMVLGGIMEFAGAVGVGQRVSDTIRTKIVNPKLYTDNPSDAPLLMLGMMCAVIASSTFLTWATKVGFPVSTTHSILGGVLGFAVASVGAQNVSWVGSKPGVDRISGGVVAVFLAWIIAPILAGAFAAIIFLITKFGVLTRKNPVILALLSIPFYFGVTSALIVMLLITKGGTIKVPFGDSQTAGLIVGCGAAVGLVAIVFLMPWLYRLIIKDDWPLRWWHVFLGPLLLRRGDPPPRPEGTAAIRNFYAGRLTREELAARRARATASSDVEARGDSKEGKMDGSDSDTDVHDSVPEAKSLVGPKPEGRWHSPVVLFWFLKWALLRGIDKDVVNLQRKKDILSGDLEDTHARAAHFDNKVEFMYSFLQVMTASVASFTHGANDVANAIGPYATIYGIWKDGIKGATTEVPIWILCFGGIGIVIGLWTYGYNIMKNLGNRITLQSPSRGFAMELGATISVIVATKLNLPISTTQCITGSTVAVGLCNGDWRSINWRMVIWIYLGWIITLPFAGIVAGCLMGIIINAPRWSNFTN